jgi:DNA-binding NtrC family response regulator
MSSIARAHLPPSFAGGPRAESPDAITLPVGSTVEETEKALILKTLASVDNNKTRAAEILGISLKTLHNKLHRYGG